MATVNKDFKIKQGLIVEGSTATVGGNNVLVEDAGDAYILGLVGGATLITSVDADDFTVTGGNLTIAAGSDLVRPQDVTDAIDNALASGGAVDLAIDSKIDSITTDAIEEGTTNLYYANSLAREAISGGDGISYDSATGVVEADLGNGLVIGGSSQIMVDRTTVDTWYDAAGSAATEAGYAQGNAEAYANTVAGYAQGNAISTAQDLAMYAQGNAEAYADSLAVNYDAAGAAANAQTAAQTYADQAAANAISDANDYTDTAVNGLSSVYDALGSADTAYNNAIAYAEGYTDNAVASLVDSAPEMLDTLNELAQALQDNPNVIADLQDVAAGKQDTLTTGNGITIDDNLIYIPTYIGSGISATPGNVEIDRDYVDAWYDPAGAASNAQSAAQSYAEEYTDNALVNLDLSGNYDALGAADTAYNNAIAYADTVAGYAQGNAEAYADGLAGNYDASGSADTAYNNAIAYADTAAGYAQGNAEAYADTVAGYAQGNAESYADSLAGNYDAYGSAANALADANDYADSLAGNYEASGAIANAINALTTDDIEEGANNLYFQDSRVTTAITNATHIAPQAIDITWVRREEATWTDISTPSQVVCHQAGSGEGSMKYLVRVVASVGGVRHSQVTELLATVDGGNSVAVVEYGTIYTSVDPLATATVLWNGLTNCYELNVETVNNNSEVMVAATLLAAID